jgi:hypothetical protein
MADKDASYSWQVPRDRSLRAADRDRAAVGEILRREHVAGRLDADEFADRYGRCLAAKTYAELDSLLADLPVREEEPNALWAPSWYTPPMPPMGPPPGAQLGQCGYRGQWRHFWPVVLVAWLAFVVAGFALSGAHVVWLVPLLLFFWVGPRHWRASRRRRDWYA